MDKDLKWIKKHYGEKMMHLCREHFYKILETEGLLSRILNEHFDKHKSLADDLVLSGQVEEFKNYIYSFVDVEQERPKIKQKKSAFQLLDEAGYVLFPECQTEQDVQKFKAFYKEDEELCTFNGGRLDTCRVWFAVKKDVENIKREDFTKPSRQDEYGTSVISIQFTKSSQALSIKNRYNHTVNNPDNTFNSYLDNIIPGLADAFEEDYGVRDSLIKKENFELPSYINVKGKFYRYNHEINDIYYCNNNIIIDNYEVKKLNNDSQILADYFVFDLKQKKVSYYDSRLKEDCFIETLGKIENMHYQDNQITIKVKDGQDITLKLNNNKQIIEHTNPNVKTVGNEFLVFCEYLTKLDMSNLISCGYGFCYCNNSLTELNLPNLTKCGNTFCYWANMKTLSLPSLKNCGDDFCFMNNAMEKLDLPNLEDCGDYFLYYNTGLTSLDMAQLKNCGNYFFYSNNNISKLNLPNLESCGNYFCYSNLSLTKLSLANLKECKNDFCYSNKSLLELDLPSLTECGVGFLYKNQCLNKINLTSLIKCKRYFLYNNNSLKILNLPALEKYEKTGFLANNKKIKIFAPNIRKFSKSITFE